jgi:hypothetical protein
VCNGPTTISRFAEAIVIITGLSAITMWTFVRF